MVLAPILLRLALHGGCCRVLHLQPVGGPTRPIARAEPLAHEALDEAKHAGPSRPSMQACWKTRSPSSCSRCSLSRRLKPALARTEASVAFRNLQRLVPQVVAV